MHMHVVLERVSHWMTKAHRLIILGERRASFLDSEEVSIVHLGMIDLEYGHLC